MTAASALSGVLDSGGLRTVGYLTAATAAVVRFGLEQRIPKPRPVSSWPLYWALSAAVLGFLGLSRATSLGGLIADAGREQARSEGWYDTRRTLQATAIVVIVAIWLIGVFVAIWRVPPRRRRYLPSVIAISALVAFAGVRVISLHQVDALLYRRHLLGVRFVAVTEVGLLVVTVLTIVLVPRLGVISPRSRKADAASNSEPSLSPRPDRLD